MACGIATFFISTFYFVFSRKNLVLLKEICILDIFKYEENFILLTYAAFLASKADFNFG